ncbi:unnamed protein product [Symbiodinium sp. CCMP2592]|nr:unnamed protein product [Symbiodinium sp. CCMP2592]
MRLLLDDEAKGTVQVATESQFGVCISKAEVGYTENVEALLESLDSPLNIVHTVNPKEVAQHFESWLQSLKKEVSSLEHAVDRVQCHDPEVRRDVESGKGQVLPMKVVYTVKPPDPPPEGEEHSVWFKRKSRIVICGNFAAHQAGEVYTNTAPAEVVRAAIALARFFNWDLGMIDVVAAFLQTPLKALAGAPLVYGIPPKALIKAGLCKPDELWRLTHAVYGLQESPKLWGSYRDLRLAQIQLIFEGKRVTLLQGTVEPSWWSVLQEGSLLIGIIVVYVDDLLICGYALSQKSYIEELIRLHGISPNRKDVIPLSKDLAVFAVSEEEGEYTQEELRSAQQWAGELLWISQRTRPDVAFTASLVGSLATRAPRRAVQIGEKVLAFLQRTIDLSLIYEGDGSGLTAYCDASFAPEGGRSHTGWLVQLNGCTISWRSSRQTTVTLSTAESELMAMSEAIFALQSVDSMLQDVRAPDKPHQLFSDSTSALAIANGSGSWRTRHLRLRSAWVLELINGNMIVGQHRNGEFQPADLLTKALASQRIRSLSRLINLRGPHDEGEDPEPKPTAASGSSSAVAPNKIPKGLIALLVLSQAVLGEAYSWDEEEALVVRTGLAVDYGMVTWALLWIAVILFLLAWELLKWLMWLAYDRATPGASSRRVRRLQKLRDATTSAIQRELEVRVGRRAEQSE